MHFQSSTTLGNFAIKINSSNISSTVIKNPTLNNFNSMYEIIRPTKIVHNLARDKIVTESSYFIEITISVNCLQLAFSQILFLNHTQI